VAVRLSVSVADLVVLLALVRWQLVADSDYIEMHGGTRFAQICRERREGLERVKGILTDAQAVPLAGLSAGQDAGAEPYMKGRR
jgi:hypothetical protein